MRLRTVSSVRSAWLLVWMYPKEYSYKHAYIQWMLLEKSITNAMLTICMGNGPFRPINSFWHCQSLTFSMLTLQHLVPDLNLILKLPMILFTPPTKGLFIPCLLSHVSLHIIANNCFRCALFTLYMYGGVQKKTWLNGRGVNKNLA